MTRMLRRASILAPLVATCFSLLVGAAPASAAEEVLQPVSYPDTTTYSCRTDAIEIQPGQNLNLFAGTQTCPNAQKLSGPGDPGVFQTPAPGYITRFKPSMVEIKDDGSVVTPSVWDLHLHHVVWIGPVDGPTVASGEEKTKVMFPEGYGYLVNGNAAWGLNYMIHALTAEGGRKVYITWEIDWVPAASPSGLNLEQTRIRWMDVAGLPQLYPVFDAERGFDQNGDGKFVFPDEVPTDPSKPGYEERSNISNQSVWTVPAGGVTLVFGAGHLHPGGEHVDLEVARDGPDPGSTDGDDPAEVRELFRSDAKYYEPAGAVSWDVSMEATRPEWRVKLQGGDSVSIDTTYDVRKASWYESMGIMPLAWTPGHTDPAAKDPFQDEAAVRAMYDDGGILTHGRLPENIDRKAGKDLGIRNPKKIKSKGTKVPSGGIDIDGFGYEVGGFSAFRDFPAGLMRPPVVSRGQSVTFTNLEAQQGMPDNEQVWHTITSCRAPCNKGSGIGYPLAGGPLKFDSGQLGYGSGWSQEVTTQSDTWSTPPLPKRGKTYTYFCRIHPFMRGSIRVRAKPKKGGGNS